MDVDRIGDDLDRKSSWRKHELTTFKLMVDQAVGTARESPLVRAGVNLLYAHWEGFVKESSELYIDSAQRESVDIKDLDIGIQAYLWRGDVRRCAEARKYGVFMDLIQAMDEKSLTEARIRKVEVDLRSNLDAQSLRDICRLISIDYGTYELKEKPFVEKLVRKRNNIAHGAGESLDYDEYERLHEDTVSAIESFKTGVLNNAINGAYLRT